MVVDRSIVAAIMSCSVGILAACTVRLPAAGVGAYSKAPQSAGTADSGSVWNAAAPDVNTVDASLPAPDSKPAVDTDAAAAQPAAVKPKRAKIPAGKFLMGCIQGGVDCKLSIPQHDVEVSAFEIDVFEVTVEQYLACVSAGKCLEPQKGYNQKCNHEYGDRGNHPVECVSWAKAVAYCKWVDARLPTEAEWERACRAGMDNQLFPWGSEPAECQIGQPNSAVWASGSMPGCPTGPNSSKAVGTHGTANGYGLFDMVGNINEWVQDWGDDYTVGPTRNPQGPSQKKSFGRVQRGGSYGHVYPEVNLTCGARHVDPDGMYENLRRGFRCARSL